VLLSALPSRASPLDQHHIATLKPLFHRRGYVLAVDVPRLSLAFPTHSTSKVTSIAFLSSAVCVLGTTIPKPVVGQRLCGAQAAREAGMLFSFRYSFFFLITCTPWWHERNSLPAVPRSFAKSKTAILGPCLNHLLPGEANNHITLLEDGPMT
jgi:hypothetical protein